MMKRKGLTAAVIIGITLFRVPAACGLSWEEIKGTHFMVFHTAKDKSFAPKILDRAEGFYTSIPERLGITRYSGFWTWENRVKIYMHMDRETFLRETRRREWVRAFANYKTREIISYNDPVKEDFLDSVLPHELAHLVFRDFLGFENEVPLWLDEGVAQCMETGKAAEAKTAARGLLKASQLLSVGTLTKLDVRRVRDRDVVVAFYAEACSLVNFMIEKHGSGEFERFCRGLRDGKTLDEALKSAYPTTISNVEKLNEKWMKHLE